MRIREQANRMWVTSYFMMSRFKTLISSINGPKIHIIFLNTKGFIPSLGGTVILNIKRKIVCLGCTLYIVDLIYAKTVYSRFFSSKSSNYVDF